MRKSSTPLLSLLCLGFAIATAACGTEDDTLVGNEGSGLANAGSNRSDDANRSSGSSTTAARPAPPTLCKYNGQAYKVGQTFPDTNGCDVCTCYADGNVNCTDRACAAPVCKYDGKEYKAGETFPDTDGCNVCSCLASGNVVCTERACPAPTCKYGGKVYTVGEQYPDLACCNLCTCQADGSSACGPRLCGPGGGNLCK